MAKNTLRVYAKPKRPKTDAIVGDQVRLPHWVGHTTITAIGRDTFLGIYEGPNAGDGEEGRYDRNGEWELA